MEIVEKLKSFEKIIANKFNNKEIRSPIHLYDGNEQQILKVFDKIDIENDWVCCTWRNHYQCLLKGVSEEELTQKILLGKSMVMNIKDYKIVTSSIVGGIPSIATGIAQSLRIKNESARVWCWLGDMSAETGSFHEAYKFSVNNKLPITFVIEDNGLSVTTPTPDIWKRNVPWYLPEWFSGDWYENENLIYYRYKNNLYPHAGAGIHVVF